MNQAYERKTQINVNYKGYILQQSSIYEEQNFYQHNLYKKNFPKTIAESLKRPTFAPAIEIDCVP